MRTGVAKMVIGACLIGVGYTKRMLDKKKVYYQSSDVNLYDDGDFIDVKAVVIDRRESLELSLFCSQNLQSLI